MKNCLRAKNIVAYNKILWDVVYDAWFCSATLGYLFCFRCDAVSLCQWWFYAIRGSVFFFLPFGMVVRFPFKIRWMWATDQPWLAAFFILSHVSGLLYMLRQLANRTIFRCVLGTFEATEMHYCVDVVPDTFDDILFSFSMLNYATKFKRCTVVSPLQCEKVRKLFCITIQCDYCRNWSRYIVHHDSAFCKQCCNHSLNGFCTRAKTLLPFHDFKYAWRLQVGAKFFVCLRWHRLMVKMLRIPEKNQHHKTYNRSTLTQVKRNRTISLVHMTECCERVESTRITARNNCLIVALSCPLRRHRIT